MTICRPDGTVVDLLEAVSEALESTTPEQLARFGLAMIRVPSPKVKVENGKMYVYEADGVTPHSIYDTVSGKWLEKPSK